MTDARHHNDPRSHGIFVTGTDTNVGKTVVTAALGLALQKQALHVGVMKPVETGFTEENHERLSDGSRLHRLLASQYSKDLVMPYQFPEPVAPLKASRNAQRPIDVERISNLYEQLTENCDVLLVEGAGGIMVPLTENHTICDLIVMLKLPCILVNNPVLGAINHTLLALEVLRERQVPILAIVLNQLASGPLSETEQLQTESTIELLRELSGVPVVGPLPHEPLLFVDWIQGVLKLAEHPAIGQLIELYRKNV